MLDVDTFLTTVYVAADTFCQDLPATIPSGRRPSLYPSEVVTLALFSQWAQFPSERAFYRYAEHHLRAAFPRLPHRSQFNRLVRQQQAAITGFALYVSDHLGVAAAPCEILDRLSVAVRYRSRRGRGWLPGCAERSKCSRLGWFVGFAVLTVVTPQGILTGFGAAPGNTNERRLADTLLALRQQPDPRLTSVGKPPPSRTYLADTGFAGRQFEAEIQQTYDVTLVVSPQPDSTRRWSPEVRHWAASHRQIIETVHERLLQSFRLERERPHTLDGFLARLAAKVGLHNVCCWLNHQLGRPLLAVANLIDW